MGLVFYGNDDRSRSRPLLELSDTETLDLEPALRALQRATGVYVDPYGTTRISPAHAQLLARAIEDSNFRSRSSSPSLVELLATSAQAGQHLVAEGD